MKWLASHITCKVFKIMACLMLLCWANMGNAQVLNELQNNFDNVQKAALHEKLYLHISKNAFLTGETIWFKVYNIDGSNNKLLNLSKVVYVDILDNSHTPVLQAKIAMNNGTGNGSFQLPPSLGSGNYQLRAYTNWMKNFDPGFYFSKAISIINPQKEVLAKTDKAIGYDIQFFPEGGHLVSGLISRVAFKITASDGKIINADGAIVDQRNDTITRFQTLKFGMGSFIFAPKAQLGYKAVFKIGGKLIVKELPQISPSGYVMQATATTGGWSLDIKTAGVGSLNVYVLVHTNNTIEIAESATLLNGSAHFNIDKYKLNEGISYLTLFNEQKQPICERLIFNRPERKLVVNAITDATVYTTRRKVNVNISTKDQAEKSTNANLSVSVYRIDSLQKPDDSNIASYLWLAADVKGKIQSPNYYLDNNNAESAQALDNLLLSQGWTQFDWTNVLANTKPHYNNLPEYTGPIVTANLVNTINNASASNINAFLTVPGRFHQLYTAKSDSAGRLMFNTKGSLGSKEIIVKTDTKHDSTYRIDILSPFSEGYTDEQIPSFTINAGMGNALIENNINAQVNYIFSRNEFEIPETDTSFFYKKPPYSYKLDEYTRFKTIAEVIHEYVRFVSVTTERGKPFLRVSYNKELLPGQATALVDGEPIFESGDIYKLDPLKIKRIDVINNNYIYGPFIFNGIISLTTYNGDRGNVVLDPNAVTIDYEGLQLQRKFYSPVYDTEQQQKSTVPDFRTNLFWSPNINTDGKGNSNITFYTGDKAGKFIGIVEGINPNGAAGSKQFNFEVKK